LTNRATYLSTLSNTLAKGVTLCFLCFFCFKVTLAPFCLGEDIKIVYEIGDHTDGEEEKKGGSESEEEESKKGSEEFIEHSKTTFSGTEEEINRTFFVGKVFFQDADSKLITPPPQA